MNNDSKPMGRNTSGVGGATGVAYSYIAVLPLPRVSTKNDVEKMAKVVLIRFHGCSAMCKVGEG